MIDVNCLQPIFLGNQGENLARTLEFDVSSWLGQYPGAEIVMLVQRPEEDAPYIAVTQVENGVLRWTPTNADTAIAGTGKIMLRLILGEKVRKSAICTVFVAKSLDEPGDAPDPAQAWVDQVIDAANKAEEGAKALLEELEPRIPPADGTPGDVLTKTENGSEWKKIDGMLPVKDVQVAGNSVLVDGVANVPIASETKEGVIKAPLADGTSGIQLDNDNRPCVFAASEADITARQTLYRPLVPARMDYAVKAAMCDGKGAAWTADEQKAAQERMGIDKPYELIEEITLTEKVMYINRKAELDGTSYAFEAVAVKMDRTNTGTGAVAFLSGSKYVFWSGISTVGRYYACEAFLQRGYWQHYRYGPTDSDNTYPNIIPAGYGKSLRFTKNTLKYIDSIQIVSDSEGFDTGTTISIYGVRA